MPWLGCGMLAITRGGTELVECIYQLQVEEGNKWEQSTNAWANWWYWTGLSWSCSIIYLSASTNYYILPTRQRSWKCWHICTAGNGHLPGAKHACSIDLGKSKREARAEQLPNMQESVLSAPSLQFSSYHLRIQIEPRFRAISINGSGYKRLFQGCGLRSCRRKEQRDGGLPVLLGRGKELATATPTGRSARLGNLERSTWNGLGQRLNSFFKK
jgi:hypothetical protein